jgi:hypothetical protein
VFGLISISILISANLNFSFFESYALIVQYLTSQEKDGQNIAVDSNDPITLIGRYWTKSYLWIPQTVFHNDFSFIRDDSKRFEQLSFTDDKRFLFVVDRNIVKSISDEEKDDELTEKMRVLYNETQTVTTIKDKAPRYDRDSYPYTSMTLNRGIGKIEIRANYGI